MTMSSTPLARTLCRLLLAICSAVIISAPMSARAQGSEEAAWKLWDSAVQLIKTNYFKPMTEAEITSGAKHWYHRSVSNYCRVSRKSVVNYLLKAAAGA